MMRIFFSIDNVVDQTGEKISKRTGTKNRNEKSFEFLGMKDSQKKIIDVDDDCHFKMQNYF